jgi:hypothetical protein
MIKLLNGLPSEQRGRPMRGQEEEASRVAPQENEP